MKTKKRVFNFKLRRIYGILDEYINYEIWSENIHEALLLAVADLGDIFAQTEDEAKTKAKKILDDLLGANWSNDDVFDIDLETDGIIYRIIDIADKNMNDSMEV